MSDAEKKEPSQTEEKEKETAGKKSPSGSKPGSARSGKSARSGSPGSKSPKGSARSQSPPGKGAKGKKAGAKKAKKAEEKAPTPAPAEDDDVLPEGAVPIFLSSKTQEIFDVRADEDVTQENCLKLLKKEDILKDLFNRAAVCDFQPLKKIIEEYPEEEILLVYDYDFKHGQNFIIATTEAAKHKIMKPKGGAEGEEGEEGEDAEEEEEEDETVYQYVPPVSKEWVSMGSEIEIEEESLKPTRKRMKVSIQRVRRAFGAPVEFVDRDVAEAKDGYIECASFEDQTFDLKRLELDKGTQAIPEFTEAAAQTDWKYPRNASTQYEPREFTEEQKKEVMESTTLKKFTKSVEPRFDLAMQQNEILDVFFDDWFNLGDDDSSFGSKADNHLKEYQSFTDLQFSKEKSITCIDWHPTIKGCVAVSVAERLTLDERIDQAAKVIMTPSLILIWSFTDPIHPQLLLEAPEDINCFRFCPSDPNIIAGGCINGQVVLWDISQHADRLKTQRGGKKKSMTTLPGFEDENALDTPIVRYCAVSSIENSHKAAITDIMWIPDHLEINRMGVPQENKQQQCVQLMTCAIDHCVLLWDTRPPKATNQSQQDKNKPESKNLMGVPTTYKHLDLSWKPMLRVHLYKSEPGGDHSPIKFSISESQGDRAALSKASDAPDKKDSQGFSFGNAKPGSASKRTLATVKTHFYVGTEDGEVVYLDWMPQKDQDTGKIQTPKPDYYHALHDGPVITVQRSPFFKDIILCVGGWSFSIWKEGVTSGPILVSCASKKPLTAGFWSPSRPAVFYIARHDGSVDIWDLLDRTHEPSMNQQVTPAPITSLFPWQVTSKQHLLAVGDHAGTLHILEIPWSLRMPTSNELNGIKNYFDREVQRRAFVVERWNFREKEKIELESELKKNAGIAPNVILSEEEIEHRLKMEYQAYVEEETSFLRELGILKEEDLHEDG